jgi:hypothetical protein
VHTRFWWGSLSKENYLEDPGVDERIILKRIFERLDGGGGGGIDWIDLTQDRNRWRPLVNKVMNLRVS